MFSNKYNNNISSSTNGGSSLKSIYNKFSGTYILYIVLALLIGFLAYYTINQFLNNKDNTSTVYTANRENMYSKTGSNAELILFYVDWCPHCKTAKPEWENLKSEYEGKTINGYKVIFTEYNCTNETAEIEQLIKKYKIEGYPTIKLLKDNQVIEYDAKPTKATLEQFLNTVL